MKQVSKRLTYGNVMSTLFVFLLLAGGTALAAKQLGKKTVGAKQLKSNAVTTAKIKKAAVTRAKIKDGAIDSTKLADNAVTTSKIADGAVTGSKIAADSTVFSRRIARLQKSELVPFASSAAYPVGSYVQGAGEDNQYIGGVDFEFAASCLQPRSATILVLLDAPNPAVPMPTDFLGYASTQDKGAGTVRLRAEIVPIPGTGAALFRTAPALSTARRLDLFLISGVCSGGTTGASLAGVTIDVIGTK